MQSYSKVSIQEFSSGMVFCLIVHFKSETSLINTDFQEVNDGLIPLKILSFLCFQIFQQASIAISMKHGPLNFCFACFNISGLEPEPHTTCRYAQILILKLHSKNKCDQSS